MAAGLGAAAGGCTTSATFYSKTGRSFARATPRAVRCEPGEIKAVGAAGGFIIGTIAAKTLTGSATTDDMANDAAEEAARAGGTHILLTEQAIETFTTLTPAQETVDCSRGPGGEVCHREVRPETTSTYEHPTARFVVIRVPPENWGRLPEQLRPGAGR
jgi:hypothetical protein